MQKYAGKPVSELIELHDQQDAAGQSGQSRERLFTRRSRLSFFSRMERRQASAELPTDALQLARLIFPGAVRRRSRWPWTRAPDRAVD